eukprot:scaffold5641_cov42-Phaeocystis_antarctica.AAC.1
MAEMMEEGASMADMQGSFASFMRHRSTLTLTLALALALTLTLALTCMRHSMGGGDGSVLMPDGSSVAAPRMAMPSLHALIEGAVDEEERALFERVGRKMGLGGRGALVAGTGMQALQGLEQLASQPGFWSDDEDEEGGEGGEGEGEDAFLDELQMQLQTRQMQRQLEGGGAPPASTRQRRRADGAQTAGQGAGAGTGALLAAPPRPAATLPPCPPMPPCLASPQLGKRWLDAAREGDQAELRALLLEEASLVNYTGAGLGQTALHWAATKGHEASLAWLLRGGAPVHAANANGATPLHAAAAAGSAACAAALLSAGADRNARDGEGDNAARLAVRRGHAALGAALEPPPASATELGAQEAALLTMGVQEAALR